MKPAIPSNSERIELYGQTAWLWQTEWDTQIGHRRAFGTGWSVLQGPYRIDLENVERDGNPWHTVDWVNSVPRGTADFEGGLARNEPGHLERKAFLELAKDILAALRRKDAPPDPPE